MRILVDSGSTSNYIDAQECATCRMKIGVEDQAEELKMAYGTVSKQMDECNSCSSVLGTKVKFLPWYFPI